MSTLQGPVFLGYQNTQPQSLYGRKVFQAELTTLIQTCKELLIGVSSHFVVISVNMQPSCASDYKGIPGSRSSSSSTPPTLFILLQLDSILRVQVVGQGKATLSHPFFSTMSSLGKDWDNLYMKMLTSGNIHESYCLKEKKSKNPK